MTAVDPLVAKLASAKLDAQKRGLWPTFRALDAAEKVLGNELVQRMHVKYSFEGIALGFTTACEYCLLIACDGDQRYPQPVCTLRLVQLRASPREWTGKMWVCSRCREYLKGKFRYVTP